MAPKNGKKKIYATDKDIQELNKKINEKLKLEFDSYKKNMIYMSCDAPIGVLCLPKVIEKILLRIGCNRVYDILDVDLTKIKGFGAKRRAFLTSSLDEFISVSF